jgi:hypothetical protein
MANMAFAARPMFETAALATRLGTVGVASSQFPVFSRSLLITIQVACAEGYDSSSRELLNLAQNRLPMTADCLMMNLEVLWRSKVVGTDSCRVPVGRGAGMHSTRDEFMAVLAEADSRHFLTCMLKVIVSLLIVVATVGTILLLRLTTPRADEATSQSPASIGREFPHC